MLCPQLLFDGQCADRNSAEFILGATSPDVVQAPQSLADKPLADQADQNTSLKLENCSQVSVRSVDWAVIL